MAKKKYLEMRPGVRGAVPPAPAPAAATKPRSAVVAAAVGPQVQKSAGEVVREEGGEEEEVGEEDACVC